MQLTGVVIGREVIRAEPMQGRRRVLWPIQRRSCTARIRVIQCTYDECRSESELFNVHTTNAAVQDCALVL